MVPTGAQASVEPPARQGAYALRSQTRWLAPSQRERGCGSLCVEHVDQEPAIQLKRVDGAPRARWLGLMTCGHIWTCPVCSQNLRAKRAERIAAAVRGMGGRWQMLTITLRHREGMPLHTLMVGLMSAWRRTRQGGRIQRLWSDAVTGSARAVEVTHGENGWHPHVHVLLRTSEWTDDDKDALLVRWQTAVRRELGGACTPSDERALTWSDPFDAADAGQREFYLAKLGLEMSGIGKKSRGASASRSHWDVARDAAEGDSRSVWLWREFQAATKGRRMLELDDRASLAAKKQLESEAPDPRDDGEGKTTLIEVKRDDVRALRRLEFRLPAIFAIVLQAAEDEGPEGARTWIRYARDHAPVHRARVRDPVARLDTG